MQVDAVLAQRFLHCIEDRCAVDRRIHGLGAQRLDALLELAREVLDHPLEAAHLVDDGLAALGDFPLERGLEFSGMLFGLRHARGQLPHLLPDLEQLLVHVPATQPRQGHVKLDQGQRRGRPNDRSRDRGEALVQVQRNRAENRRCNVDQRQHDVGDNRH